MNQSDDRYLFRTNYFHRPWTWIRRASAIVVLSSAVMFWNADGQMLALKPMLILLIAFILVTKQKDEVAIGHEYFYYIKRSILPVFTRVKKYRLEEIVSMRRSGVHNDTWELVDFFGAGGNMGGHSNKMEITFRNGSSRSIDLRISRDNLNKIVSLAKKLTESGDQTPKAIKTQ